MTNVQLTLWIRNGNRNLQHAIADRQSNFQACSFNHSDISPYFWNQPFTSQSVNSQEGIVSEIVPDLLMSRCRGLYVTQV
jgi:hypothetical protein